MMPNKKVCILLIHNKKESGLYEYAQIYNRSYKNSEIILLSDLYPNESHWNILLGFSKYEKLILDYIDTHMSEFDLVHVCDNPVYAYKILRLFEMKGLKTIYTLHDPTAHTEKSLKNRLLNFTKLKILHSTLKKISKFKYVDLHLHYQWDSVYKKQPIVSPHPLYLNKNFDKKESDIFTVGFFGRIEFYKGYDIFLEIMENLDTHVDNEQVKVLVVGQGNIKNPPKLKNINFEIHNYFVESNLFNELFSSCDVVLLPYRQASQSGVLMKALSYNIPVMVSDIREFKAHVVHLKSGFVIGISNTIEWVEQLMYLMANRQILIEMNYYIDELKKTYDPYEVALKLYSN